MTTSMRASLTAIGRQLQADYLPIVRAPLPRELKEQLARLVMLEAGSQGPTVRSIEALQPAIAQPVSRS